MRTFHIDKATVWTSDGNYDAYGNPYYSREVIDCRWEEDRRTRLNNDGEAFTSSATVFVDKEFPRGAWFKKGEHTETEPPSGSYEVKDYAETKNLRGTKTERHVIL